MRQSFPIIKMLPVALLAACASSLPDAPQVPDRNASRSAEGSQEIPPALRRAAYDAPDFSAGLPPDIAAVTTAPSPADSMPVVAAQGGPVALEPSGAPTGYSSQVPTAPTQVRGAYEPGADFSGFDPVVTTPGRAPRAQTAAAATSRTPAAAAPPRPPRATTASVETPSDFQGATASVMSSATPTPPVARRGPAYGIHLASYRDPGNVARGWTTLQRSHSDMLGGLSARGAAVTLPGKGNYIRLIVGPFSTPDDARALCAHLKSLDEYCKVMPFDGAPV